MVSLISLIQSGTVPLPPVFYVCVWFADKKISDMDAENKITHKHMKRLRKKLNSNAVTD